MAGVSSTVVHIGRAIVWHAIQGKGTAFGGGGG